MIIGGKKKELDMLHGAIWSKIPQFAFPVAATGILGQLFNASDIAIVGQFSGENSTVAVAAVGANSAIISLVVNLFLGIALGANVVIANAVGRDDRRIVHLTVHSSIVMALIGGIGMALIGELAASPLLSILSVPEEVFPLALLYLRIYLGGLPVILLYNFEAAIFRSVGETRIPLFTLAFSGVLNVILNIFFVVGMHMSVSGVAIATVISNAVSAVILWVRLMHTDSYIRLEPRKLRISGEVFWRILRIGLPAGLQSATFAVSNILVQSAVNSLGTVIMAASSASYNLEIFVYDVLNSFSQACTTFVGQNYGAGQLDRCKRVARLCWLESAMATGISVLIGLFSGKFLLSIFNSNSEVIAAGYTRMMIIFATYVFTLTYETMSGYLRGFGNSLAPALLTMLGVCGIRFFWIGVIFPLSRTFRTIMLVYPVSLGATTVLVFFALFFYRPAKRFADCQKKE